MVVGHFVRFFLRVYACRYPQAIFCLEEVVLLAPSRIDAVLDLSEVQCAYSAFKFVSLILLSRHQALSTLGHTSQALQNYVVALVIDCKNLRALWGFVMVGRWQDVLDQQTLV